MTITVKQGHLTQQQIKVVKVMLSQNLTTGRAGRTDYHLHPTAEPNNYKVTHRIMERHCIGADLKPTFYTAFITVKP